MPSGENPNTVPSGMKGKIMVKATIDRVATNRYFPGLLLKKGFLIRIERPDNLYIPFHLPYKINPF